MKTIASRDNPAFRDLRDLAGPVAWLFGNEGGGIAPGLVGLARRRATVPLAAGNESLNVAAAVCLFEMRRQRICVKVDAGRTA